MLAPFKAFKNPEILDVEKHKNLKIKKPLDYFFAEKVEVVPLTFSELLPVSMYYPVMFASFQEELFPFAVIGIEGVNVYLNEEGSFKVDVIPRVLMSYPFGVIRQVEGERTDWLVLVDLAMASEEGEPLFEEDGSDSPFLKSVKTELSNLALDFQKVYEFTKTLIEHQCLKPIDFEVKCKYGRVFFRNVYIGNIDTLAKLQPEKLYFLNALGYLPIIYSIYLSVRNFKLFDLI